MYASPENRLMGGNVEKTDCETQFSLVKAGGQQFPMINSVVFSVQVATRGDEALGRGTPPRAAGAMMSQGSIRRGCELPKQMHSPVLALFHKPSHSVRVCVCRSSLRGSESHDQCACPTLLLGMNLQSTVGRQWAFRLLPSCGGLGAGWSIQLFV